MKKLLGLLGAMGMVASTGSAVVSCGNKSKDEAKATLESIVKVKALGEIEIASDAEVPTLDQLLVAIKAKNASSTLTKNDVELDGAATATKAKIKAKADSSKYTGTVEVSYTVKKAAAKATLESVVTKNGLDTIKIASDKEVPTDEQLIEAIKEKNSGIDLTNEVTFEGKTATEATVKAKEESLKYTGTVKVSYKVEKAVEKQTLESVVKEKTLGQIDLGKLGDTPSIEQLISAINGKNASLNLTNSDVEIDGSATETTANLKAKTTSSKYSGTVTVTYTVTNKKTQA
ncbi:lipoprotein [Spiroplasma apis]|uniref:Lipoprotein n=1 Tax=Spiroplasma apis B31 TaxID=1276258 RepID=V5RK47_SPIAP|nr:lipoprotein [Spiroplasma apis]AHB36481.1 hypothetical protein SAPIS_v1c06360 [Spiroplasma apis B31]